MGVVNSDTYDYIHNDEKIAVHWQLHKQDVDEYRNYYLGRIQFEYKEIEVTEFYEYKNTKWYNITRLMCNLIDKLGKDKFLEFREYYDEFKSINEIFIVVDNKVYKPFMDNSVRSGQLIYYIINMSMEDDAVLNGRTNFSQDGMNPFAKEEHNKDELINRLRYRVRQYFDKKGILPKESHLQKKETEKYQQAIEWFKMNNVLEYIDAT